MRKLIILYLSYCLIFRTSGGKEHKLRSSENKYPSVEILDTVKLEDSSQSDPFLKYIDQQSSNITNYDNFSRQKRKSIVVTRLQDRKEVVGDIFTSYIYRYREICVNFCLDTSVTRSNVFAFGICGQNILKSPFHSDFNFESDTCESINSRRKIFLRNKRKRKLKTSGRKTKIRNEYQEAYENTRPTSKTKTLTISNSKNKNQNQNPKSSSRSTTRTHHHRKRGKGKYVSLRDVKKKFCKDDFLIRGILQDFDEYSFSLLVLFHADFVKGKVKKATTFNQAKTYKLGFSSLNCKKCDKKLKYGGSYLVLGKYRKRPILDQKMVSPRPMYDRRYYFGRNYMDKVEVPKIKVKCVSGKSGLLKKYRMKQVKSIDNFAGKAVKTNYCFNQMT